MIIIISIGTFLVTLLGGLFALRFKNKLYLILGFSAGAVIGIAFFDLMPAGLELTGKSYGVRSVLSVTGLGFLVYLLIDRIIIHRRQWSQAGSIRGKITAFCLIVHSFFDGVTIGLGYQVSAAIGGLVATAVLVHDFADGVNTINVILKENGERKSAIRWLTANAIAPIAGAFSTYFYHLSQERLGIILALVSGFFIYIGASDFLPESQKNYPKLITSFMTILGIAIIYAVVKISGT